MTVHSSPFAPRTASRPWTPVAFVVVAALAIGGIAAAASLDDGDGSAAGPGGRLAVQHTDDR